MSTSSALTWQEEDLARARSFTQHLCDTLALASIVGAANGFVVGVFAFGILGAVLGTAVGLVVLVALLLLGLGSGALAGRRLAVLQLRRLAPGPVDVGGAGPATPVPK